LPVRSVFKSAELNFDCAWDKDDFAESFAEFPRNFAETKDAEEVLGTFNGVLL
jgi:hypothetical protein